MTWKPLVSIVTITRNRAWFTERAIHYANTQTYPKIEIIVADGTPVEAASGWHFPRDHRRYPLTWINLPPEANTGTARNIANDAARGEVIVHFDDDDWQSARRVEKQVTALAGAAELVQTSDVFMWWLERGAARYYHQPGQADFVLGATLAYFRSFWKAYPFPEDVIGEDPPFVRRARELGLRVVDMRDPSLLVYLVHGRNTSAGWAELGMIPDAAATARARELMGDDVAFWDDLNDLCPKYKAELAFNLHQKGLRR